MARPPRHRIELSDLERCELERGYIHSVAFAVPSGASWTLPLYELAVMTASHGWRVGIDDARHWFVTPEPEPLAIFGPAASLTAAA